MCLGIFDSWATPVPQHMQLPAQIFGYNGRVLVALPWRDIFHPDSARRQDFDEAIRTHNALLETYLGSFPEHPSRNGCALGCLY